MQIEALILNRSSYINKSSKVLFVAIIIKCFEMIFLYLLCQARCQLPLKQISSNFPNFEQDLTMNQNLGSSKLITCLTDLFARQAGRPDFKLVNHSVHIIMLLLICIFPPLTRFKH